MHTGRAQNCLSAEIWENLARGSPPTVGGEIFGRRMRCGVGGGDGGEESFHDHVEGGARGLPFSRLSLDMSGCTHKEGGSRIGFSLSCRGISVGVDMECSCKEDKPTFCM